MPINSMLFFSRAGSVLVLECEQLLLLPEPTVSIAWAILSCVLSTS